MVIDILIDVGKSVKKSLVDKRGIFEKNKNVDINDKTSHNSEIAVTDEKLSNTEV